MFFFLLYCLSVLTAVSTFPQDSSTFQETMDYQGLMGTNAPAQIPPSDILVTSNGPASNPLGQSSTVDLDDPAHVMRQGWTASNGEADHTVISDLGDDMRHGSDQFNQDMDSAVKKIDQGAD